MILTTDKLTKKYKAQTAINHLNLSIEKGSLTALLGPNGAGKSTTMQLLIGLIKPTSGKISYQNQLKIGAVFQTSVLDDMLTVKENLQIRAEQYHNIAKTRVKELIDQLGLVSFSKQTYGNLSGGQKRRVDIARALLNEPEILFLDEPTTGLDIQTRANIWALLKDLQTKQNLTIVLTTHYLNEVDEADKIFIIDHGTLITQGSAQNIKQRFANNLLSVQLKSQKDLQAFDELEVSTFCKETNKITFSPESSQQAIHLLTKYQTYIQSFEFRLGTIDDAFMNLTGNEVR